MQKVRCKKLNLCKLFLNSVMQFQGFSHPFQGSFHLSLTVVIHYRLKEFYLDLDSGLSLFNQNFTCSNLLKY